MDNRNGTRNAAVPVIDEPARPAGVARLVILGLTLAAVAAVIFLFGKQWLGEPLVLSVLGGLAGIGVFFIFALSLGFLSLASERRSESFTRNLVDGMEAGLQVIDPRGRVVYANRAFAELTGAADAAAIASVEALFSRRAEAADAIYRMANAVGEGRAATEEVRLSHGLRQGEEGARWFRLRARPMAAERGGKPNAVWQVIDITAERRGQERAFQQLQSAIHYLDHAPAGFFSAETDGSLVYINATLADWLGIDLARFAPGAMRLSDIVPGDGLALIASVKADPAVARTSVIDLDLARSDGTRMPARLFHRVPANPDGAPGATRTVVINRLAGEDGRADAELRFTRFFNDTPFAIATLAADGIVRQTNAPFLRMFANAAQRSPLRLSDLGSPADREALGAAFAAALAGQARIAPVETALPGEKGRHARFLFNPVSEPGEGSGKEERVIAYVVETTEQKALEEQFAQSQKMQAVGQLAGGVAHDFNNVLTAIIGFSDLLLANHRPSDPSFQDILNIKQNANRAASLVRQLLAFSRRQTLRPQVLHLGDVLSDLRMLLDRLLGENVTLGVVHGRDVWPVMADISQFETVIINLAVNARDAMQEGGKVTIRTSNLTAAEVARAHARKEMPAADYVLIEVEDEGAGIAPEIMDKIFEPFFSTKEVGKGTGLGLSTVYGIIKQSGGFIYPRSQVGKGTTFAIYLPRHIPVEKTEAELPPAAAGMKQAPAGGAKDLTGNARILLVEDEDAVRAFASRALKGRGYEVHEAASGVEALEKMAEIDNKVDLVISDVVMPEMDGPTLLRQLRGKLPKIKFVFMSGYAEEAFAKNLPDSEREQFGFLPKPFTLKQLVTTVKETLEE
jgi:two-component system cell cycle sensor histidine kinase/response regulator CckA